MANVGDLVTRLIMDSTNFDSTINRSQREINAFRTRAESVGRGVNSVFNGMAGAALKLVPAIAAGTTALGAFNKIISNSGSLADSLDKVMLQVGSSIDYIASRAADLNFDGAVDGLRESVKLAGDLADILDEINSIKTYKGYQNATTERLRAEEKYRLEKWELNPSEKNKRVLDAVRANRIASEGKDLDLLNKHIKELDNEINNEAKNTVKSLGLKKPLVDGVEYAKEIATSKSALEQGQKWAAKFEKFRSNSYRFGSGMNIFKSFNFKDIDEIKVFERFAKYFKKVTGLDLDEKNYNKVRAYSLLPEKEGVSEDGESKYITKITELYQQKEEEQRAYFAGLSQSERLNKRENKEANTNRNKVNTKLTNTNETLEEINKKFADAKTLLSLQLSEGNLDKESYLKELLKATNNYIDKLYDPLYANLEGVKDLRSAAISAKEEIIKQLKDLNKPQEEIKFGNIDFNLISSDLYRQVERVIASQLGSFIDGREYETFFSDWYRFKNGWKIFEAKPGDDVSKYIYDTISINRGEDLNYGNVLATILENEKDINKILNEKVSEIFNDAFKHQDYVTASQVYDFLNAIRIMSALPEEMARKFKEVWIDLIKNPDKAVVTYALNLKVGDDIQKSTISSIAASQIPDINKYVDPDYRPISNIQETRLKAANIRGISITKEDLDDFYKQNAPVQTVSDLTDKLRAFKDFNKLDPLQYFNSLDSQLTNIDSSIQNRIKILKSHYLGLLNWKHNFEEQIRTGKYSYTDENGKTVEKELTEEQKTYALNQLKPIELETNRFKEYIKQLEDTQEATQKLVQVSQVFNIKQKEIKESFDVWRTVYGSLSNVAGAFSEMDNKVGDFAKSLEALSSTVVMIADLIEQLNKLSEAKKASAIADEILAASTTASTAAILTNTAASGANAASNTVASTALTETAVAASTAAGGLFAAAAAAAAATAANVGEAASEGTKQASKLPFPANIAAIATVLTAIGGAAATISSLSRKKYATGGIVTGPGSSFSDSIPISVSNGEMILNKSQQKNLFDLLNYGGGSSRGGGSSEVNFKILGENLVGSINNRNKGRNKIL